MGRCSQTTSVAVFRVRGRAGDRGSAYRRRIPVEDLAQRVIFKTSDQVGIALVGIVIACVVLMFARPRVRAGSAGIEVRNVLGPKLIPWSEVVGVSFPRARNGRDWIWRTLSTSQ